MLKKLLRFTLLLIINCSAKTEHIKPDYHFHIYNETNKPMLISFFIEAKEFEKPTINERGEKELPPKIGLFNYLITAQTDQKVKLGEFGWFEERAMGLLLSSDQSSPKTKTVPVLMHGFADTFKICLPGPAETSIMKTINLEERKHTIRVTQDSLGKIFVNINQTNIPCPPLAQTYSPIQKNNIIQKRK